MTVRCPACNSEVIVPTIRNLAKLPVVEDVASASSASRRSGEKSWNLPLGIFAAICFLIFCYTAWQSVAIFAERRANAQAIQDLDDWGIKQELDYGDEMVAQYSNADLWDVWNTYRSDGLASKHPPEFVAYKKLYDDQKQTLYTLLGIAAGSLACMVLASFAGRRKS